MMNMIVGKVVWWSSRDNNGVITDPKGNEYYFDKSVIDHKKLKAIERGSLVLFEPGRCDKILAAKVVTVPNSRSLGRYSKVYEQEKNQLSLPLAI